MPIYEYECAICGTRFERLQRFSDAPPAHCPQGHNRMHKVLSPPLIIFKGSGFYCTDNCTDNGSRQGGNGSRSKSEEKWESASEKLATEKKRDKESHRLLQPVAFFVSVTRTLS